MRILATKPGRDGHVAALCDGRLEFSIEEEKDSRRRRSEVSLSGFFHDLEQLPALPDVFAVSGWHRAGDGYEGIGPATRWSAQAFGQPVEWFHSTHEKSHLFGSYAMSPFPQGQPCYALVWEGLMGRFYRIDESLRIHAYPTVLAGPGRRYAYLHYFADPSPEKNTEMGWETRARKLMALAGFGRRETADSETRAFVDRLLDPRAVTKKQLDELLGENRERLWPGSPLVGAGFDRQDFRDLVGHVADALFTRFRDFAAQHLTEKLPLLIGGGCGMNAAWNSRWQESGLFSDVFIPPCCDDTGSAIGTAAEAHYALTGKAKIEWSVYAGEEFVEDWPNPSGWDSSPLDFAAVADLLRAGHVVAWVQGRYEIGPRALGNRSLLAAPFAAATATELRRIKEREDYRPIAPVCLQEDFHLHFDGHARSPYMLYSHRVKDSRLTAVTHADGTACVQTVTREDNARLHALLTAFKAATGVGVLDNTSLNFPGRGLINHTTHLLRFAHNKAIGAVVINDRLLVRRALIAPRTGATS